MDRRWGGGRAGILGWTEGGGGGGRAGILGWTEGGGGGG